MKPLDVSEAYFEPGRAEGFQLGSPDEGLAELLIAVDSYVRRFVVLSDDQAAAVALWIAHTHAFDAAHATAYLSITSAEKRSGKTRLLEALELVVARPWLTGRTTAAALVRKIAGNRPTLLLDESDAAFRGDKEYAEALRGILNSGHRAGGCASLCIGQGASLDVKDFPVFSPKAIAGIGMLPDTVADRSVPIRLKRRAPGEPVERFRRRDVETAADPLRDNLAAWADSAADTLAASRPDLPAELDDRAADGWEPLFAIADLAGGVWPARARRAAVVLSGGDDHEDDSLGVRLLGDVRRVFDVARVDRISTADLIAGLVSDEEAPWGDWRGKGWIRPKTLARFLHDFGIRSGQLWIAGGNVRGYARDVFEDAWRRYLPILPLDTLEPASVKGLRAISETLDEPVLADGKQATNPHEQTALADLAGKMLVTGDPGFLDLLDRALEHEVITARERRERRLHHLTLVGAGAGQ